MATYGDLFLADYRESLEHLKQLTHEPYTDQDVRNVISKIGTKTELYLKATALPAKNPRDNFYSFINELSNARIDQSHIDWFHDLRRLYNDAKHDPNAEITLLFAIEIIQNAEQTAQLIVANSIGHSARAIRENSNRVYWLAAWDHYTSGDTEIHILLPGGSEHWLGPPTFDMVNIKALEWDEVKSKLSMTGILYKPDGMIPEPQLELFKNDGDFLAAFVWEGEYRVLLNILSQHEICQELISGLNRKDTGHYMQIAFLMAMLDVIATSTSVDDLRNDIRTQATTCYGVPPDYKHMAHLIDELVSLVQQLDADDWANIHGPKWLTNERWDEDNDALARHENGYLMIDSNYTFAMRWKT